jgi:hypothetical protein
MRFWIAIEDTSHDIVGDGPINTVTRCTTKSRVNRVGEFSFEMPATDPRASYVTARRSARIYAMLDGVETFLGGGSIDKITTSFDNDGVPMLQVSGSDFLTELSRISTGKLNLTGTGDDNITTLIDTIMAPLTDWDSIIETGSPDFVARFVYEPGFNAILSIAEKTGAYFHLDTANLPTRTLHWFYSISGTGILATMHGDPVAIADNPNACLITGIQVLEDSTDLKTRCYIFGSGEGDSITTALYAQNWPDGSLLSSPLLSMTPTLIFRAAATTSSTPTPMPPMGVTRSP